MKLTSSTSFPDHVSWRLILTCIAGRLLTLGLAIGARHFQITALVVQNTQSALRISDLRFLSWLTTVPGFTLISI